MVAVSTARGTTWRVRRGVSTNRGTSWGTRAGVSTARGSTWAIRTGVQTARASSWSLATLADPSRPDMRIVGYLPNGASLGRLPGPTSVTAQFALDDLGGLTLDYALSAPRSALLGQPIELAVELSKDGGDSWFEPVNGRFVYLSDGIDPLGRPPSYSVDAKAYLWTLSKAKVLPWNTTGQVLINADGKRAFLSESPGVILKTLLNEGKARGALAGWDFSSFSNATDSAGVAWGTELTIYYDPGLDYLSILTDLAQQGYINYRTLGRSLQVFKADTYMARDRSVGANPITVRAGRDVTEAPFRRTWESLANYAYFAGEGILSWQDVNPSAETPWGRWETFVSNGSVNNPVTAHNLNQAELALGNAPRTEYTRGLDFSRAAHLPMMDYNLGDFILSAVDGTVAPVKLRVRQVTLTRDDKGNVGGNVVLNDRFLEADIRTKRRISGITNGASSTSPGTGGPGPIPNKKPPAKVQGVTASSSWYLAGTNGYSQLHLTWGAVTTNDDGTAIDDLDHYEVYKRPGGSQQEDYRFDGPSRDTLHDPGGYVPGSVWWYKVRAVDQGGNKGDFSDERAHSFARKDTPPEAPSVPTLTTRLGIISITWNGAMAVGLVPPDLAYVEVHASQVNSFTPSTSTLVGRLYGKGTVDITDPVYDVPLFVRLVAVDTSKNVSDPSGQSVATPTRFLDIANGSISYAQIAFKDPGNIVPDGSFETESYREAVGARSESSWTFTQSNPFHRSWCAVANMAVLPSTTREMYLTDGADEEQQIRPGEKLFVRFAAHGATGTNGTISLNITWNLSTGGPTNSVLTSAAAANVWVTYATQLTAPANAVSFTMQMVASSAGTTGEWRVDAVEVRRTIATAIIEDAAITNAKIDNLAVNDAKIASLDVGKLTAGTMSANVLISGTIRTATSGNRMEMTSAGIKMYRGSSMVGDWAVSNGQLTLFSTGDLTPTSVNHALQLGADSGQNLALDEDEIMSRRNGEGSPFYINRNGGRIWLGGAESGVTDGSGLRTEADPDYNQMIVNAHTQIITQTVGDYERPVLPLMIGRFAASHAWYDHNKIGASDSNGNPTGLGINPNNRFGTQHSTGYVELCGFFRARRITATTGAISTIDGGDAALQFTGSDARITNQAVNAFKPILASAFTVSSSRLGKKAIRNFDPFPILLGAPAQQWQYADEVEEGIAEHYGPMLEDLPESLHRRLEGRPRLKPGGRADVVADWEAGEDMGVVDLAAMVGVLWEAVRRLAQRAQL